jgi:hypothetical protein
MPLKAPLQRGCCQPRGGGKAPARLADRRTPVMTTQQSPPRTIVLPTIQRVNAVTARE